MKISFRVFVVLSTIVVLEASANAHHARHPQEFYSPNQWKRPEFEQPDQVVPRELESYPLRGYQRSSFEPNVNDPGQSFDIYRQKPIGYPSLQPPPPTSNTYRSAVVDPFTSLQRQPGSIVNSGNFSPFKILHIPLALGSKRDQTIKLPISDESTSFRVVHISPSADDGSSGISSHGLKSLRREDSDLSKIQSHFSPVFIENDYNRGKQPILQQNNRHENQGMGSSYITNYNHQNYGKQVAPANHYSGSKAASKATSSFENGDYFSFRKYSPSGYKNNDSKPNQQNTNYGATQATASATSRVESKGKANSNSNSYNAYMNPQNYEIKDVALETAYSDSKASASAASSFGNQGRGINGADFYSTKNYPGYRNYGVAFNQRNTKLGATQATESVRNSGNQNSEYGSHNSYDINIYPKNNRNQALTLGHRDSKGALGTKKFVTNQGGAYNDADVYLTKHFPGYRRNDAALNQQYTIHGALPQSPASVISNSENQSSGHNRRNSYNANNNLSNRRNQGIIQATSFSDYNAISNAASSIGKPDGERTDADIYSTNYYPSYSNYGVTPNHPITKQDKSYGAAQAITSTKSINENQDKEYSSRNSYSNNNPANYGNQETEPVTSYIYSKDISSGARDIENRHKVGDGADFLSTNHYFLGHGNDGLTIYQQDTSNSNAQAKTNAKSGSGGHGEGYNSDESHLAIDYKHSYGTSLDGENRKPYTTNKIIWQNFENQESRNAKPYSTNDNTWNESRRQAVDRNDGNLYPAKGNTLEDSRNQSVHPNVSSSYPANENTWKDSGNQFDPNQVDVSKLYSADDKHQNESKKKDVDSNIGKPYPANDNNLKNSRNQDLDPNISKPYPANGNNLKNSRNQDLDPNIGKLNPVNDNNYKIINNWKDTVNQDVEFDLANESNLKDSTKKDLDPVSDNPNLANDDSLKKSENQDVDHNTGNPDPANENNFKNSKDHDIDPNIHNPSPVKDDSWKDFSNQKTDQDMDNPELVNDKSLNDSGNQVLVSNKSKLYPTSDNSWKDFQNRSVSLNGSTIYPVNNDNWPDSAQTTKTVESQKEFQKPYRRAPHYSYYNSHPYWNYMPPHQISPIKYSPSSSHALASDRPTPKLPTLRGTNRAPPIVHSRNPENTQLTSTNKPITKHPVIERHNPIHGTHNDNVPHSDKIAHKLSTDGATTIFQPKHPENSTFLSADSPLIGSSQDLNETCNSPQSLKKDEQDFKPPNSPSNGESSVLTKKSPDSSHSRPTTEDDNRETTKVDSQLTSINVTFAPSNVVFNSTLEPKSDSNSSSFTSSNEKSKNLGPSIDTLHGLTSNDGIKNSHSTEPLSDEYVHNISKKSEENEDSKTNFGQNESLTPHQKFFDDLQHVSHRHHTRPHHNFLTKHSKKNSHYSTSNRPASKVLTFRGIIQETPPIIHPNNFENTQSINKSASSVVHSGYLEITQPQPANSLNASSHDQHKSTNNPLEAVKDEYSSEPPNSQNYDGSSGPSSNPTNSSYSSASFNDGDRQSPPINETYTPVDDGSSSALEPKPNSTSVSIPSYDGVENSAYPIDIVIDLNLNDDVENQVDTKPKLDDSITNNDLYNDVSEGTSTEVNTNAPIEQHQYHQHYYPNRYHIRYHNNSPTNNSSSSSNKPTPKLLTPGRIHRGPPIIDSRNPENALNTNTNKSTYKRPIHRNYQLTHSNHHHIRSSHHPIHERHRSGFKHYSHTNKRPFEILAHGASPTVQFSKPNNIQSPFVGPGIASSENQYGSPYSPLAINKDRYDSAPSNSSADSVASSLTNNSLGSTNNLATVDTDIQTTSSPINDTDATIKNKSSSSSPSKPDSNHNDYNHDDTATQFYSTAIVSQDKTSSSTAENKSDTSHTSHGEAPYHDIPPKDDSSENYSSKDKDYLHTKPIPANAPKNNIDENYDNNDNATDLSLPDDSETITTTPDADSTDSTPKVPSLSSKTKKITLTSLFNSWLADNIKKKSSVISVQSTDKNNANDDSNNGPDNVSSDSGSSDRQAHYGRDRSKAYKKYSFKNAQDSGEGKDREGNGAAVTSSEAWNADQTESSAIEETETSTSKASTSGSSSENEAAGNSYEIDYDNFSQSGALRILAKIIAAIEKLLGGHDEDTL